MIVHPWQTLLWSARASSGCIYWRPVPQKANGRLMQSSARGVMTTLTHLYCCTWYQVSRSAQSLHPSEGLIKAPRWLHNLCPYFSNKLVSSMRGFTTLTSTCRHQWSTCRVEWADEYINLRLWPLHATIGCIHWNKRQKWFAMVLVSLFL